MEPILFDKSHLALPPDSVTLLLRRWVARSALLIASVAAPTVAGAQGPAPATAADTFAQRLARAYSRLGSDLLIIRSRWAPAGLTDAAFDQEPSFFYFTGDEHLLGAVLVIDGATHRTELFLADLPPDLRFLAPSQAGPSTLAGSSVHVDHVSSWNDFGSFVDNRLSHAPRPTIYVDDGGDARSSGNGRTRWCGAVASS